MDVFDGLLGQQGARRMLGMALEAGRLPQALVFVGPEGVGRRTTARMLASYLHGDRARASADTFWFEERLEDKRAQGATGLIKATMDDMVRFLQLSPLASKRKVAIVGRASELSEEAQNALLKSLEEPSANSLIVLVVESEAQLLPTIISRAKVVRFGLLSDEDIRKGLGSAATDELVALAGGSLGRALGLAEDPESLERVRAIGDFWSKVSVMSVAERMEWSDKLREREKADQFLREGVRWMRAKALANSDVDDARRIEEVSDALRKVEDNANVRLALDSLMLVL